MSCQQSILNKPSLIVTTSETGSFHVDNVTWKGSSFTSSGTLHGHNYTATGTANGNNISGELPPPK
jgi:hypothetical protein